MSSRQHIEDRATDFLLKREGDAWSSADQAELAAWIEASTAHRVAFLRAEAAWEQMGRLKALGAGLPNRTVPTPAELDSAYLGGVDSDLASLTEQPPHARGEGSQSSSTTRRLTAVFEVSNEAAVRTPKRRVVGVGVAAGVLVVAVLALVSYRSWVSGDRYSTTVGGVAALPLEDGSRILLNTDSRVRVVFDEHERHVDLARGEAFFEVARDMARPFVVQARGRRVVAVGTKFSVRHEDDGVQVVVTEGKVRVEDGRVARDAVNAASGNNPRAVVLLAAGSVARASQSDIVVQNHPVAEAEELLSWRNGYVVFHGTPLSEAVAEFNRYNARPIVIDDASVGSMQLTGKFRAANNEAFVKLLEETYQIRVERTPVAIVLGGAGVTPQETPH